MSRWQARVKESVATSNDWGQYDQEEDTEGRTAVM
jgi:hypothetical protein